ncbi:MAG: hypothetical protein DRP06_00395 [Candidatus Aenigmatarchaeota archaeon]|nr:MAG: hypothetical protein DRP06_00395 [Candidatus Aenigmarchaeota archaeon]
MGSILQPLFKEFENNIQSKEEDFLQAKIRALIYLDEGADEILSEVLAAFRQLTTALVLNLPDEECYLNKKSYDSEDKIQNLRELKDCYDEAVNCLKSMLNPKILEFTKKIK